VDRASGANVAYASSGAVPRVRATVALAPVSLRTALRPGGSLRPHGVLFVSSRTEAAASLELAADARPPKRTLLASSADRHGVWPNRRARTADR
jgi:hypothetical protein